MSSLIVVSTSSARDRLDRIEPNDGERHKRCYGCREGDVVGRGGGPAWLAIVDKRKGVAVGHLVVPESGLDPRSLTIIGIGPRGMKVGNARGRVRALRRGNRCGG